jgi:hypothetical protein
MDRKTVPRMLQLLGADPGHLLPVRLGWNSQVPATLQKLDRPSRRASLE